MTIDMYLMTIKGCNVINKAGPMLISFPVACINIGLPSLEITNKAPCFVIPRR